MTGIRRIALFAALGAALSLPQTASAQQGPVIQGSYAKQLDAMGIGVGAGFSLGEPSDRYSLWGQATLDYFFVDKFHATGPVRTLDQSYYEFNLNMLRVVHAVPGLYLGGGMNYSTRRIDGGNYTGDEGGADLGLSLIGGLHFGPGKKAPFIQARYELGGGKQFVASFGLAF